MKRMIPVLLFLLCATLVTAGEQKSPATAPGTDSLYVFRFVAENDMFYIPWKGNDRELAKLIETVAAHHDDILARQIPVVVDGWCTSYPDRETNLRTAATRSNRVKSELILRAALKEDCFVTRNHAEAYEGQKDIVTVALRIPAKTTVKETVTAQTKDTVMVSPGTGKRKERTRQADCRAATTGTVIVRTSPSGVPTGNLPLRPAHQPSLRCHATPHARRGMAGKSRLGCQAGRQPELVGQ